MIDLAKDHFKKVIELGVNRNCPYYPCHFDGQTCIWCFCPFYPCEDYELGEYIEGKNGKIWSCQKCFWIHKIDVAIEVYKEILYLIKYLNEEEALDLFNNHKLMLSIKDKVKERLR
ncbi:cysteine-rich small domain-containing protein [Methanocaldococcus sp.]